MTGTNSTLAAVITMAALMTGCASGGQEQGIDAPVQSERVTLTVENQNWQDATIYIVGNGPRIRLGTVATNDSDRFEVPPTLRSQGTIQLAVHLIGSSATEITEPIMVNGGSDIRWTIQNHLALSSYRVR